MSTLLEKFSYKHPMVSPHCSLLDNYGLLLNLPRIPVIRLTFFGRNVPTYDI